MISPHNAPDFKTAIRMGAETFNALNQSLIKGLSTAVGDEGGLHQILNRTKRQLRQFSKL